MNSSGVRFKTERLQNTEEQIISTRRIDQDRIQLLNDCDVADGDYVLYWMQQSQRAEDNHALEFAIQRANASNYRLLACFGLTDEYPDANLRHYQFMLEGLVEVEKALRRRKVRFVVQRGDPAEVALRFAGRAAEVICDRGYLRHQRQWRRRVAHESKRKVWQIESDTIVPVEVASDKQEYAARTIRPKLNALSDKYCQELATTPLEKNSINLSIQGIKLSELSRILDGMSIDQTVKPVAGFSGGSSQARAHLRRFFEESLAEYGDHIDPVHAKVSMLSPYLHFGQISPASIVNKIKSLTGHTTAQKSAFLEELLVRRELAINFVHFHSKYDSLQCLPDWASQTLAKHEQDEREFHYTAAELEAAHTHDPAWNAAMIEMKRRGYLHNHLRMYWGKKIIEWTNTTQHAYRTTLKLNNRYFLDGRDPNSYANVAWLFGLHDRAHQERPIFGKIRYMSADGLRRKFDVDAYIESISREYEVAIEGTA